MTVGPGTGGGRIVVGVDGSQHSQQALRWGAHLAAVFGARLDAVSAWEFPLSYGWASVPVEWNPGQDMERVLDDTVRAVFGDQPPAGLQRQVREGAPPRSCSTRARARSCWWSAAAATGASPGSCSVRSARMSPSTPPARCWSSTAARHRPRQVGLYDPSWQAAFPRGPLAACEQLDDHNGASSWRLTSQASRSLRRGSVAGTGTAPAPGNGVTRAWAKVPVWQEHRLWAAGPAAGPW